jgi:DNA polymerase-4
MILHVDMDAFYASVEERDRPELVGKPVIIGGTPEGRGVVAAANYVVRKYGVHSAMASSTAKRLCPHAIVLPPRMEYYAEVSEQIREIFLRFTPLVEPLSLDEAFLDVTGSEPLFGTAVTMGQMIKSEISKQLRLVASVGVAPNKFLAKIASDLKKPDGFVVVEPYAVQEFLDPLPVSRLWGVGRVTGAVFDKLGIHTIRDVRNLPQSFLEQHFGEHGAHLWELAQGIDDRRVIPDRDAKSISHETTFARDIIDLEVLQAWVTELAEQVAWRLRRHKLLGRTIHLKVRFNDFRTITRAQTLAHSTNTTEDIRKAATEMLLQRLPGKRMPVRLLGVGVSGFATTVQRQRMLFDDHHVAQTNLDKATDRIRDQFGMDSLSRASGMLHHAKHKPMPRPNREI